MVAVGTMAALVATLGPAGAGPTFGDFVIDPTSGTAGQQVQITASDGAPACSTTEPFGLAPIVLGTFASEVEVTLWNPGKTVMLDQEIDTDPINSGWSVILTMPSGQPAGSYPISAECVTSGASFGFYTDQIFTLVAAEDSGRARPVEAEVTLTG
jgi:hypothetical protein